MKHLLLIFVALSVSLHAAAIKFEKDIYEADVDFDAEEVIREFKFTNTSSKAVKIDHVDPGCTCVTVEFLNRKSTYGAGESGVMRVTFKLDNAVGTVDKPILVYLAGDPEDKPSTKVTFRIHIPIVVSLDTKTLTWDVGSKPEPKTIRVTMNYDKPIHVTSVSSTSENISSEIVTIEEGKTYDIRVTPKSTATGGIAVILIKNDIEIDRFSSQQAYARFVSPK